jgi:flagellar export protein FliJ
VKNRRRKIGKVASIAAADEQRYGQIAGQSQRHLDDQLQRLGELNAYRQNYTNGQGLPSAVSSVHWKDYQNFRDRLDAAVAAQQQIVQDCERTALAHRQHWLAKRRRVESLERMIEKYRAEESLDEDRREQKVLDDLPKNPIAGFGASEE